MLAKGLDVVPDYARLASQKVCFGSLKKKDARLSNYKAGPGERAFYSPGSADTSGSQSRLLTMGFSGFSLLAETRAQSGLLYGSADLGRDCAIARDT